MITRRKLAEDMRELSMRWTGVDFYINYIRAACQVFYHSAVFERYSMGQIQLLLVCLLTLLLNTIDIINSD